MRYNSENDPLIRSDIEELHGDKEPTTIENGSHKALIVEFSLPSSSYATMALREILKCDTSVASQVNLQQTIAKNQLPTDTNSDNTKNDANTDTKEEINIEAKDDAGNQSTDDIEVKKPKLDISST